MNVFVTPNNSIVSKQCSIFNLLQILWYDPATERQIRKLYPKSQYSKPTHIIKIAEVEGLITFRDDKFWLTSEGQNYRYKLAKHFEME